MFFLHCERSLVLQELFQPLHVHGCEQLLVDIFGFPLAIFTKVSKVSY